MIELTVKATEISLMFGTIARRRGSVLPHDVLGGELLRDQVRAGGKQLV
jgi:hypothetical protein